MMAVWFLEEGALAEKDSLFMVFKVGLLLWAIRKR